MTTAVADDSSPPLYKFVLTGGPCGGKTTGLARVFSYLRERGFEVITCPEAYTILSSNGMSSAFYTTPGIGNTIQNTVCRVQMVLEEGVEQILKARGKPAVILCDRGTMDGSVYMDDEDFFRMLSTDFNTDVVQMRDHRYDAVFHLVTAADGAPEFYTLENNQARTETADEARSLDQKTQQAWVGHPHYYVLDNSTDFEGKMGRLVDIMSKIVGLPSNLQRRSAKFLLRRPLELQGTTITRCASFGLVKQFPDDIRYQEFQVEKVYLQQTARANKEDFSFIRRRTHVVHDETGARQLLGDVYQITNVRETAAGEMIESKRIITKREYLAARQTRDRRRHIVRQRRISFLYRHQSFVIHSYEAPAKANGLSILHAQVQAQEGEHGRTVDLPPFLDVERQLFNTKEDEDMYGAYSLSLIGDSDKS